MSIDISIDTFLFRLAVLVLLVLILYIVTENK